MKNKINKGTSYLDRWYSLRNLGYSSYAEYLASSTWKEIRSRVFKIKGRTCFLCGGPATQVHHNRYSADDLIGRTIKFLFPICEGCHKRIEFSSDGQKRQVRGARRQFKKRLKARRWALSRVGLIASGAELEKEQQSHMREIVGR
jgi:hypothetical protein